MKHRLLNLFSAIFNQLTPVRIIVVTAIIAFFWFVILGDKGIYQLRRLIEMKSKLSIERQNLNDKIDKLTEERELLKEPANLEPTVRSELGYIKPGEVVFEEKKDSEKGPGAKQP